MKHLFDLKVSLRQLAKMLRVGTFSLVMGLVTPMAQAALIDAPLPANAYITRNGYDWAWGANCSSMGAPDCSPLEFGFQSSQGWRIAQASDMALAPTAMDFLFAGANVPFNGTDPVSGSSIDLVNEAYLNAASSGACASSYFTLGGEYNTCDWINGSGQDVSTNTLGWFNQNGENNFYAEVLFIRSVPEPATAVLFFLGAVLLLTLGRKEMRA
jgi:hypothetical protein